MMEYRDVMMIIVLTMMDVTAYVKLKQVGLVLQMEFMMYVQKYVGMDMTMAPMNVMMETLFLEMVVMKTVMLSLDGLVVEVQ